MTKWFHKFPATKYERASPSGWYFEHRATGELIGPFSTQQQCLIEENRHYNEPFEYPAWALYQS